MKRSALSRSALQIGAVLAVSTLALAGCSAPTPDDGVLRIVASTNVYGSIAQAIAGDHAEVTSIITSPDQDPHDYEATARDQLAISKADIVIENGGGYDPFIDMLLSSSGSDHVVVLNAVELSGLLEEDHDHDSEEEGHGHIEGFNEHIWYSLPAMERLAGKIAEELTTADSANAAQYEQNLKAFEGRLNELESQVRALHERFNGEGTAITEPVPLYLLEGIGLVNRTPAAFSEAVEAGTDVPPAALQQALAVLETHQVRLLVYNEQTSGPEMDQLIAAAGQAGVPAIPVAETLPEGKDYLSWMDGNLAAIATALG